VKTKHKRKTYKQQSMEALACPCEHLGVINFLAIHKETMKAYTLWCNGGTFQEMLDYNTKYSLITHNRTLLQQGGARYGRVNMTCHL
jgi:hypothetical protein